MKVRQNLKRYSKKNAWEEVKNAPYDYENNGLLNKIMSHKIVESKNFILKNIILKYFENSLVFIMKYTDVLKNFKNYHWQNR